MGPYIVVGTSIPNRRTGGFQDDLRAVPAAGRAELAGRILLLALAPAEESRGGSEDGAGGSGACASPGGGAPPPALQLAIEHEAALPGRVLALCVGGCEEGFGGLEGSNGAGGGGAGGSRLFASMGRRLVSFTLSARSSVFRRMHWVPTNRPVTSLQVGRGRPLCCRCTVLYCFPA